MASQPAVASVSLLEWYSASYRSNAKFPWKLIFTKNWQDINALEGNPTLKGLRWLARQRRAILKRTALYTDSQVIYHMLAKKRSSTPSLRHLTHRVAAVFLSYAIIFVPIWIPSAQNPADGPFRLHYTCLCQYKSGDYYGIPIRPKSFH